MIVPARPEPTSYLSALVAIEDALPMCRLMHSDRTHGDRHRKANRGRRRGIIEKYSCKALHFPSHGQLPFVIVSLLDNVYSASQVCDHKEEVEGKEGKEAEDLLL